jgi:3-oxoadipate enol-lactonase
VTTGFAPADKAQIFYESVGEGHPVLFLHAGVTDSRMWNPQFEDVPDGFHFVRIDLRGFGNTKIPKEQYTDCEDTLAVMDHLEIERATIVGCSIGAEVALDLVALAPYRLSGLTVIGGDAPGFEPLSDYRSEQWPEAIEAFDAGDLKRAAELEAEIWLVGRGRDRADVDPTVFEMFVEMDLGALKTEAKRDQRRRAPHLEALPHVDIPTLIVVGEHDMPQLIEASEHLEEMIEHATRVVIEDAAHLPSLEQPEAFNESFYAFLRG